MGRLYGQSPAAGVVVNGQTAYRHGSFYHRRVEFDNALSPVVGTVDLQEVPGDQSLSRVFIPVTPEVFTHDDDGNLIQDGVWNYEWDAENRLRAMWPRPEVAMVMLGSGIEYWPRIEFVYDFMGRRIAKNFFKSQTDPATVTDKNAGAIVWAANGYQQRFVYDGWTHRVACQRAGQTSWHPAWRKTGVFVILTANR